MKKLFAIRMEEGVGTDLKILAAIRGLSMGDMVRSLVQEEVARSSRVVTFHREAASQSGSGSGEVQKKKKKHR